MAKQLSPFSTTHLITQEETLEIQASKIQLFIGIPKEIHFQERRICLTPDAVGILILEGHKILIESGAGLGAGYSDTAYSEAGASITNDIKRIYSCPVVLKIEPPTLEEIDFMSHNTVLISALQLKTREKKYFQALSKKKITALAFEFLQDEDGSFPIMRSSSEISGAASILIAAELMSSTQEGNGLIFGNISGVPPVDVVIIGAGTVGEYAARSAMSLGANIKIFDNNINKLRNIQISLGKPVYTSTIQPKNLMKALSKCDVAIGGISGENRSPIVVSKEMVQSMKPGAVIIDVSIDMGGCFETSEMTTHNQPYVIKNGIIHYGVPNIPAKYPKTASISVSNIFTPYLLDIANYGGIENAIKYDSCLKTGLYFYKGILTNKSISHWFDIPYNDINLYIF